VDAEQLQDWVRQEFAKVLGVDVDEVQPTSNLSDDLDADSVDLIEVVNAAEAAHGVVIEEQDLYEIKTIDQFSSLLASALG